VLERNDLKLAESLKKFFSNTKSQTHRETMTLFVSSRKFEHTPTHTDPLQSI